MDMSLSPVRSDWIAWCSATSVVEQAVSIVMLAPRKSKKWEIRLAAKETSVPVAKERGMLSSSRIIPSR